MPPKKKNLKKKDENKEDHNDHKEVENKEEEHKEQGNQVEEEKVKNETEKQEIIEQKTESVALQTNEEAVAREETQKEEEQKNLEEEKRKNEEIERQKQEEQRKLEEEEAKRVELERQKQEEERKLEQERIEAEKQEEIRKQQEEENLKRQKEEELRKEEAILIEQQRVEEENKRNQEIQALKEEAERKRLEIEAKLEEEKRRHEEEERIKREELKQRLEDEEKEKKEKKRLEQEQKMKEEKEVKIQEEIQPVKEEKVEEKKKIGFGKGLSSPDKIKECEEEYRDLLPRMFDYVDYYGDFKAKATAVIEYDTGDVIDWATFARSSRAFGAKLYNLGLKKGDIIATQLPMLKEHLYLMYGAMRIGVILAPLDLRLKGNEIIEFFNKIKPKMFFFLGETPRMDFRPVIQEVYKVHAKKNGGSVEHWIQIQKEETGAIQGAITIKQFASDIKTIYVKNYLAEQLGYGLSYAESQIKKRDPVFIIFTTGSTGQAKAALLCHENIHVQNIGLKVAFMNGLKSKPTMLVNLPPSHVGCLTEQLATTIYAGGVCVLLHVFDAEKSLLAIEKYKVNAFGQIPALFEMQWRLPNYDKFNLKSLSFALYGGQAVTSKFLDKLSKMAPKMGSGIGLTEAAGFTTYTPLDGTTDDILASLGFVSPLCPISIREPMESDRKAGKEKKPGEIGEICFKGPQIFLGYYGDPEQTKATISSDGWLYTGDIGSYDETGLHFSSRRKFIIKPKGHQVYPPEIEDFILNQLRDEITNIAVVGVKHEIYSEAVVVCIEGKDDKEFTLNDIKNVTKDIAAFKRPSYVMNIKKGKFPLNRVAKSDYKLLQEMAEKEIDVLRSQGKWDKE